LAAPNIDLWRSTSGNGILIRWERALIRVWPSGRTTEFS
jgi:hypothetical protein